MYSFCTLFDSNYIDKGLALYYSLKSVLDDFCLYIFAFDDIAYNILTDMNLEKAEIIGLKEFETKQLLGLKKERSKAEYCWTCTPITIEYILNNYAVDMCTYIDADLYFFSSPEILFKEIMESGDSVIITEHRFRNNRRGKRYMEKWGKYCVQFNTFKNNDQGREVLSWWKNKCIESCYYKPEENQMGDQKYLESWTRDFKGVHELRHLGGGVAPWNLTQYRLSKDGKLMLVSERDHREYQLIFYHFQNLRYLPFEKVNINVGWASRELKLAIYIPYLRDIERIRAMLYKKYNLTFIIRKHCASNKVIAFIQRNIMQYKVRSLFDIISLKKIRKSIM